jgi:hypothetical protein
MSSTEGKDTLSDLQLNAPVSNPFEFDPFKCGGHTHIS